MFVMRREENDQSPGTNVCHGDRRKRPVPRY